MTAERSVEAVREPDYVETLNLFADLKSEHQRQVEHAWIGALVTRFTNDQLRVLADAMTMGDTLTLRRLGLLAADEGFDGTPESQRRCRDNQRQWHAKIEAQKAAKAKAETKAKVQP